MSFSLLIRGIKRSNSEVWQGNAVGTLRGMNPSIALIVLSRETKGVIPYQQKERLEAAERRVGSGKDSWDIIRSSGQRAQP
jgi:hypothetical protein